ncbi:two-component system chemotaxis response regulator CheB [Lentzea atacamensis]|uniref:protein-glutamate methylesterase n=2 Tax=Lentzea TaxID=165301 RepID=A0A316HN40_9PSEU|nr:chemotaxis protein CheB [Lentzea atacamensis]PWK82154.1 two-component system chemotaxis response regulator CheB [Lentzea atacamensis]
MAAFDVVCMAASMGGVVAYRDLVRLLPETSPAAIVLVQHRTLRDRDAFVDALRYRSVLPVRLLSEGDRLSPGVVHVVPARSSAVLTAADGVRLRPVNDYRSADPLFTSAAAAFGPRVLAAVLTGRLDDAALGVRHVKGAGGRVLAQEPATAAASGMPSAAIATGCVDFVLPLPVLAHALVSLVMAPGAANMMRVALPSWATAIPPVAVG